MAPSLGAGADDGHTFLSVMYNMQLIAWHRITFFIIAVVTLDAKEDLDSDHWFSDMFFFFWGASYRYVSNIGPYTGASALYLLSWLRSLLLVLLHAAKCNSSVFVCVVRWHWLGRGHSASESDWQDGRVGGIKHRNAKNLYS